MLNHGGRLIEAAQHSQIPLENWVDLSTGINPNGYPIPAIPPHYWQRLPEEQDGLLPAAHHYYQCPNLLAVAGSQAAIQTLPLLRTHGHIGCLTPSYNEHAHAWQKNGHRVHTLQHAEAINQHIQQLDVLILVNPNNPSGDYFTQQHCLDWLNILQKRQGWLIIDEAFIDCTPELSLSPLAPLKGLIILRSIGKFFGLAGARTGFVLADNTILTPLQELLGPWAVSSPSRFVTQIALQDNSWQQNTRIHLQKNSRRLAQLLTQNQLSPTGCTALFQWVKTQNAQKRHQQLAQQGIFTRLFTEPLSLRFGLPRDETQWQRLKTALQQ